ncbi:hypothetical protein AAVH_12757 [Aphelenchoides avenae]|nr:hypothetical protein AAVH_12757 [Aphelenchus avenae]
MPLLDCATIGVSHLELPSSKPVDAEYYQLTEDGIISFCFDSSRPGDLRLIVSHPRITSNFFSALVEAHQNSSVDADLKLSVRPASGQNVSAYSHLMRRVMGADGAVNCYDFEGPVHMQICFQEDELILRRGKFRADGWFIRF